jgi:hypothetical protein
MKTNVTHNFLFLLLKIRRESIDFFIKSYCDIFLNFGSRKDEDVEMYSKL